MLDEVGKELFELDDQTIRQVFALLVPLTQVPDPVRVLDGLLGDPGVPALAGVEAWPEETSREA